MNISRSSQRVTRSGDDDQTSIEAPGLLQWGDPILVSMDQKQRTLNRDFRFTGEFTTKQLRVMGLELRCGSAPTLQIDHG